MNLLNALIVFCLTLFRITTLSPQNVTIPDTNFKTNLVGNPAINTNGDTEIQVSEAVAFSATINCASLNIANLTGIEAFVNLTRLYCDSNPLLSSLDVTQNSNLTRLKCGTNQLSSLDLTQNTNLIYLDCYSNQLSNLDISNSNNSIITCFRTIINPNLTCIQVDDSTYSTNNWTNTDVIATFSTNCSVFSNVQTINKEINLRAYPNPTTKNIRLDFGKNYQAANIQVTNLTGQVILNRNLENVSSETLELKGAAGVYFVKIQTEEETAILKVIKE
jgi:hypothetical protein